MYEYFQRKNLRNKIWNNLRWISKCEGIISEHFIFFFYVFIYFCDRERQSMSRGGAEREGDTESKAGSRLWAVSTEPDAGLEPTDCEIMTWAKVGCSTDWATQAPPLKCFLKFFFKFIYFWETEYKWGRSRDRETQNPKQFPGSELSAPSPMQGSIPWIMRSWPEPKSQTFNQLSHPGARV